MDSKEIKDGKNKLKNLYINNNKKIGDTKKIIIKKIIRKEVPQINKIVYALNKNN